MVLVDTSVWVDHFRASERILARLLEEGEVAVHPFILGGLACGNIGNRKEILSLLDALPKVKTADDQEILLFMEKNALHGKGLGYVDVCLLASCRLSDTALWTKDRRLANAARELGISRK